MLREIECIAFTLADLVARNAPRWPSERWHLLGALFVVILSVTGVFGGFDASRAQGTGSPPPVTQWWTPPPIGGTTDANGFDFESGHYRFTVMEVAIGPAGAGGLSFGRTYSGDRFNKSWRDLHAGTIKTNQTIAGVTYDVVVSYQGGSFIFDQNGSNYSPRTDIGISLEKNGSIYTLTSAQGDIVRFSENYSEDHNWQSTPTGAVVIDMTRPNGEVITYNHRTATVGSETRHRVQSISNNFGYMIHFEYHNNSPTTSDELNEDWLRRVRATGVNLKSNFCSANADSCSGLAPDEPYAAYSLPPDPQTGVVGFIELVENSAGEKTFYTFDTTTGALESIVRAASGVGQINIASIEYDVLGQVETIESGGVIYSYGPSVSVVAGQKQYRDHSVTSIDGAVTSGLMTTEYTLSPPAISKVIKYESVIDRSGPSRWIEYTRDTEGQLTGIKDHEGRETIFDYDSRGNLIRTTEKAIPSSGLVDIVTEASFPASCSPGTQSFCNKPLWTSDARGFRTTFQYASSHGGVTRVDSPRPSGAAPAGTGALARQLIEYETRNARFMDSASSFVNGSSVTVPTKVTSCATGNNLCSGEARQTLVETEYEASGSPNNVLPTIVTTEAGDGSASATVTTAYDDFARPISFDGPLPGTADTTHVQYDALGRVVTQVDPDPDGSGPLMRRAVRSTYDGNGLLISNAKGTVAGPTNWSSFSALASVEFDYDSFGRLIEESTKTGSTIHSVTQVNYDGVGRVKCSAYRMDPTTFSALPSDACVQAVSSGPRDRITQNIYDNYDQLVVSRSGVGTSLQQDTKTFGYTTGGQVDTVADALGNLTKYEYDGFRRLYRTYYPDPTTTGSYSASDYTQVNFDAFGRVTSQRDRAGQSTSFTYDNLGRVKKVNAPGSVPDVTYTYDKFDRTVTVSQTGQTFTYVYDALSRVVSETGPLGAVSYEYDEASRRTRMNYPGPNNFYVTYDYDVTGDLTHIREKGATSGVGVLATYAYDDWGRRTSLTRGNGVVTNYGFDARSRLSSLSHDLSGTSHDQTFGFTYNQANQITERTSSNATYDYAPGGAFTDTYTVNGLNQATSVNGAAVTHDARGNVTNDGGRSYSYDEFNRVTGSQNGATASYDPIGRLYEFGIATKSQFLYDGEDVIAEYDGTTVLRRFVHGPGVDEPLVRYNGQGTGGRNFLIADERGSVIGRSNNSGASTLVNRYDEYGVPDSGNAGRFQYTGQIWINTLDLYHYKARAYNPELGQFMQTDPIGYGDGMNLYAYVGGDPVNRIDPTGTTAEDKPTDHIVVTAKPGKSITAWASSWFSSSIVFQGPGQDDILDGGSRDGDEPSATSCPNSDVNRSSATSVAIPAPWRGVQIGGGTQAAQGRFLGRLGVPLSFILVGGAGSFSGTQDLYRGVSAAELTDIFSTVPPSFRPAPNSLADKQFFLSLEGARQFSSIEIMGVDAIVTTRVDRATLMLGTPLNLTSAESAGPGAVSFPPAALPRLNQNAAKYGIHVVEACGDGS